MAGRAPLRNAFICAISSATLPALAGMPAAELIAQMKAFRSGARPATVMRQLALGYSDAQIEALGAFFASQPR